MKIFITFDYELFFGKNSGTVENSIIKPTEELIKLGDKYNVNFIFFVDSGFLIKLDEFRKKFSVLDKDYKKIINQIKKLVNKGHEVQLHIHPHWENSFFNGKKWIFDTTKYRLHQFKQNEIMDIVYRYKKILSEITGENIFAYRAGGWSIQPFIKIKEALKKHNIYLDSTVFYGGYNKSETHFIDFRKAPFKDSWKFEDDVLIEEKKGFFTEIPITSWYYSPLFFWKFAYTKKLNKFKHKIFGDGSPIGASKKDIIKMLMKGGFAPVSTDGYKSVILQKAFNFYQKKNFQYFVTIGHPKALSIFSLKNLEFFIRENKNKIYVYKDIY